MTGPTVTATNYGSVSRRLQIRHLRTRTPSTSQFTAETQKEEERKQELIRSLHFRFSPSFLRCCASAVNRVREGFAYLAGGGNFERIFATALLMVFVVFSGVGLGSTTPLAVPRQISFLEVL